jgi:hypothetical protein
MKTDTRTVRERIEAGVYENDLQYPTGTATTTGKEARAAYNAREAEISARFKRDLLGEHGVTSNSKADEVFRIAWDRGRSSGYGEVAGEFAELVGLIK